MKHLLPLIVLIVISTSASGQLIQAHFGATTAVNATFVLDKGLSKDPRYNSEMTYKFSPIGFNFGIDLGKKFGLSLEAIKSQQGQVYQMIDAAKSVKGERKIDMSFLQLPMLMKFMSGGNGAARANFNFGPQLSLLTAAKETVAAQAGSTFVIPEGQDFASIDEELKGAAIDNLDGTYSIEESQVDVLSKKANDFKKAEFSLAIAFGLDVDLSKHMYLSTQVRSSYSITDMRNGDVIEELKNGNNIFGKRANLLVGVQLGLHYVIGKTRSHRDDE